MLSIRPVFPSRLERFSEILVEASAPFVQAGKPMWPASSLTPDALREQYGEADEFYLGRDASGQDVATLILQLEDTVYWPGATQGEALYVHKIAVLPEFAGQGIGKRLLDFAWSQALTRRCVLRLDCDTQRSALCAFYTRNGFEQVGERLVGDYQAALFERLAERTDGQRPSVNGPAFEG